MMIIENFKIGDPKTPEQLKLRNQHNVMFLYSSDGVEWYSCQQDFVADTLKIAYDADGVIRSIAANKDVSTLWPDGLSVAEVRDTTANRRADISGDWVFDGQSIIPRQYSQAEREALAQQEKDRLIALATKAIAPLQDAANLGIATEEEAQQLKAWMLYRVQVNRVEVATAPEITWPEVPDVA